MRALPIVAVLALGLFALSCGDSNTSGPDPEPDPVAGWLSVRLTTSNSDDGGIMFTVSGGQIDSIRSSYSELHTAAAGSTSRRVIVAGTLTPGGVIAEVLVPNVQSATNYSATVEQVAARDTYQQRPTSSVSLAVER